MLIRKKWLITLTLLTIVILYLDTEPAYLPTAISVPSNQLSLPKVIAHKGRLETSHFPANSRGALTEVLASSVDALEVDVRISKDGIPFLFHPQRLEESTNNTGFPESFSWKELKTIQYRSSPSETIMSLEELFKIVGSKKWIFLDVKSKNVNNEVLINSIKSLIKEHLLFETVIVESFNPFFLTAMRLEARDVQLMLDFTFDSNAIGEESQSQFDQIPWLLKQAFVQKQLRRIIRPDYLGPRWTIPVKNLKKLITHGYPIITWTLDSKDTAHKFLDMGIKSIQTNKPLQMVTQFSALPNHLVDAGGVSAQISDVRYVQSVSDVLNAIRDAKQQGKKISVGGRRHSMGGQTLLSSSIHLNMMGMNQIHYDAEHQELIAEAGATWKQIQLLLDKEGRSVKIMQSDNIFTVGGSLSVNAHGWQVKQPPIVSSVKSLKIATANGEVIETSLNKHPNLFRAVIGGYGQLGVILEARLETVPNSTLKMSSAFFPSHEFISHYTQQVNQNPNVELAYGRLSVAKDNLFDEAELVWFERIDISSNQKLEPESFIALKRAIFRQSQYSETGKEFRWASEKLYTTSLGKLIQMSRNTAMYADVHVLWPLKPGTQDILQEYFIPKSALDKFLKIFKTRVSEHSVNLLNVTIREVLEDKISLLNYAQEDSFALVCLFNYEPTQKEEVKMKIFTQAVIEDILSLSGSFYLPYRKNYTNQQLRNAYPKLNEWMKVKLQWDPDTLWMSQFGEKLKTAIK
ncbi:FAD-binding protein [Endozoicomonas sp. SM1973]|uniref:FAD-binding protein n=1 Tax=Spartinivicinus marinus TaxID=2994442 RepID=A0A853IBF3_9GAMM|nr:FAD-binding protein [Spartinivicinus marinus]MCX4026413.1 FAD-binding protein [Spartinivicinus marinus]NYZ69162.1 FAD-binding protein [Spartinivicinus marinus]